MKPNMIKKWSIALLVAAGATGLTGCEGMRVDEGASTATNNGNIQVSPNGAALKANLSGTVVDDFGVSLEGVSVYAYGRSTVTDSGGNWIMTNVPVTGINVNSTPQNLEQTTDVVSQGNLYISYNKTGYAEYRSKISNPGVITHYGTAGGNPNSIVVDGLMASEAIQLPMLVNTITGVVVDKGSYYENPVGEYAMASGISVRLIPATDVVNNAYDSAATSCYEGCGFYSVSEIQATTAANGAFEFKNVPKIPGGYIMRVDDPKYRPMARPNDGTGFSYDYDAGTQATLNNDLSQWGVSVQAHENQNYWWGIDFDVKSQTGATTFLDTLYVGDFLVAPFNYVEGITVGGKYGYPDESSGETSDDGHNALDGATDPNNDNVIDSNIVDLGVTPLKFIFSGDMIPHTGSEIPANAIVVFDNSGNQLTWDSTKTSMIGRTLTLQLGSTPNPGSTIYVRLHRDVFANMTGTRLTQNNDPNNATFSDSTTPPNGSTSDPANDDNYYTEYEIVYVDPLITAPAVENVTQATINRAIPLTAALPTASTVDTTAVLFSVQASDFRVEELVDAVLVRTGKVTNAPANVDVDGDTDNEFLGTTANISFTAVNGGKYRLTAIDDNGVSLALANTTATDNATATDTTGSGAGTASFNISVGSGTTGSTFIDFIATVGSGTTDSTATVQLSNVQAGYKVTVARINDFGDIISSSASQTITIKDDFEPHVAIQNSNHNGQDTLFRGQVVAAGGGIVNNIDDSNGNNVTSIMTAEMLFECGVEASDDNGEQEIGDAAYYFPKLNLSASLYDRSKLRSLTEVSSPADLLSTAMDQNQTNFSRAEDFNNDLTNALVQQAIATPLLATTAATASTPGTTDNTSRSDRYYNASDYTGWGLQTSVLASDTCTYYTAAYDTNTGTFLNRWDQATKTSATAATLVAPVNTANSIADNDSSALTSPLSNYSIVSGLVRSVTIAGGAVASVNAPTIEGPTGCLVPASSTYNFARTAVLNMTESVTAPADLAVFKSQAAACGQINIKSGTDLDASGTGLTSISGPSSGYNNDHLMLTFGDWRTIDNSRHFTTTGQAVIANSIADGSSLDDLMQVVSLTDTSGLAATAGNGRGVLIVDATPPLATVLSHNGNSITVKFDQPISLTDNGEGDAVGEFQLEGEGGVTYTVNLGTAASSTNFTIMRDNVTGYIDRYGDLLADDTQVDITVTSAVNTDVNVPDPNNPTALTITITDPDTTSGASTAAIRAFDYSDYLNDLSYSSAAAAAGTSAVNEATMNTAGFWMDYPSLRDTNFNSWDVVEEYDTYDNGTTPRLLGVDGQVPRVSVYGQDAATPDASTRDVDGTYLHLSSGITVTSTHVTRTVDTDHVYSPSTDGTVGANTDSELAYIYGTVNGATAAKDAATRLIIKTSNTIDSVAEALAFVYNPDFTGAGTNVGLQGGTIITATTVNPPNDGVNVTLSGGGAAAAGEVALDATDAGEHVLIVLLPDLAAVPTAGDQIWIQNIAMDGHFYSIAIDIPLAQATGAGNPPSTTEAGIAALATKVYRHVSLDAGSAGDTIDLIQTSDTISSASGNINLNFRFREPLATTVTGGWTRGDDDDQAAADGTVNFAVTGARSTADKITMTLNANDATTNPVVEGTSRYVGHDAQLTMNVSDHSGNPSTLTVLLQKGHDATIADLDGGGGAATEEDKAVLNIISGSAID
jgi:hypothetical protein